MTARDSYTSRALGLALMRVARDLVVHVVVDPVREGRMRPHRWPRGLAPVVVVALSGYGVAVACVLLAGVLRAVLPLDVSTGTVDISLPTLAVGPAFALIVLSLSLAQTAALHVPLWLGAIVTLMGSLVLISIGAGDVIVGQLLSGGRVVSLLAALALWALLFLRRRRRFAWGEFAAVFAIIAIGIAVPLWNVSVAGSTLSVSPGVVLIASTLQSIGALAIPVALAAGAAVVQLACSMATVSVASVRRHLPAVIGLVLLLALAAWRVWVAVQQVLAGDVPVRPLVAAVVLLGATAAGWVVLARLRRSAGPASPASAEVPGQAALQSRFAHVAQPIAVFLTIGVFPTTLIYVASYVIFTYTFAAGPTEVLDAIGNVMSSYVVIWGVRLTVGVALLALAVRSARRGTSVTPELFAAIGVVIITVSIAGLFGLEGLLWTGPALTVVITAAALALLAWWGLRRRLTATRAASIGVALLIAALFDQRTFVEDPFKAVFGFTGFIFLLFGFTWAMLTFSETANQTSARYPRASRVLLLLANSLFGVTVLAFSALARDPSVTIDLGPLAELGEQLLGTGLLAAALLAALATGVGERATVSLTGAEDVTRPGALSAG